MSKLELQGNSTITCQDCGHLHEFNSDSEYKIIEIVELDCENCGEELVSESRIFNCELRNDGIITILG